MVGGGMAKIDFDALDPDRPFKSLVDLGLVRFVTLNGDEWIETPPGLLDALAGFLRRLAGMGRVDYLLNLNWAWCDKCAELRPQHVHMSMPTETWQERYTRAVVQAGREKLDQAAARALSPNAGHVPLKPLDLRELQEQLRPFVETSKAGRKEKEARMAFHTAYGSLPDPPDVHAQTLDELRLERGNRVQELLDSEAPSTLALLYKALYARGMRVGGVDQDIEKALRKELGKD